MLLALLLKKFTERMSCASFSGGCPHRPEPYGIFEQALRNLVHEHVRGLR